jgi:hypothetical protein
MNTYIEQIVVNGQAMPVDNYEDAIDLTDSVIYYKDLDYKILDVRQWDHSEIGILIGDITNLEIWYNDICYIIIDDSDKVISLLGYVPSDD